jgi:hypothetical protein
VPSGLRNINRLVFITQVECVYCAVRAESYKTRHVSSLKGKFRYLCVLYPTIYVKKTEILIQKSMGRMTRVCFRIEAGFVSATPRLNHLRCPHSFSRNGHHVGNHEPENSRHFNIQAMKDWSCTSTLLLRFHGYFHRNRSLFIYYVFSSKKNMSTLSRTSLLNATKRTRYL